jgi:hypothetical protein
VHAPALHLEEVHSADGSLAVATMLFGVMGLLLVTFGQHQATQVGTIIGAVGVLAGLSGQFLSRTRPERFVDVIGLTLSALAFALGLAFV